MNGVHGLSEAVLSPPRHVRTAPIRVPRTPHPSKRKCLLASSVAEPAPTSQPLWGAPKHRPSFIVVLGVWSPPRTSSSFAVESNARTPLPLWDGIYNPHFIKLFSMCMLHVPVETQSLLRQSTQLKPHAVDPPTGTPGPISHHPHHCPRHPRHSHPRQSARRARCRCRRRRRARAHQAPHVPPRAQDVAGRAVHAVVAALAALARRAHHLVHVARALARRRPRRAVAAGVGAAAGGAQRVVFAHVGLVVDPLGGRPLHALRVHVRGGVRRGEFRGGEKVVCVAACVCVSTACPVCLCECMCACDCGGDAKEERVVCVCLVSVCVWEGGIGMRRQGRSSMRKQRKRPGSTGERK